MFRRVARDIIASKKEDFDSLLKRGVQKQREEVASALKLFSYFDDWSENTIKETCSVSNVRTYLPNKMVLDGTKETNQNFTYFILEGSCCVIHCLRIQTRYVAERCKFKLLPDQASITPQKAVQKIHMQTCVFRAGVCFGLGENLRNKWVVTMNNVKCLRVPLHVLMAYNKGNVWCRIRQFLNLRFPTAEEVFNQFVALRRWSEYREQYFKSSIEKKNIKSGTYYHDVPYSCRVNNEFPPITKASNARNILSKRRKKHQKSGVVSLSAADIKLLEDQNAIYEDFLDTLAHLKLRAAFK